MKNIDELRDYLLDNFVDEDGDLDLMGLDFSDFNGNVYITGMKVKGGLHQDYHDVEGDLHQGNHIVRGSYVCKGVIVGENILIDQPAKMFKEITTKELEEMGYKLKDE